MVSKRLTEVLKHRKKWLTRKGIGNVLLFSAAILVIAFFFEIATSVISSNLSPLEKGASFVLWWLLLAGFILLYAMLSPDLMDTVFQMLGFKQEELKKEESSKEEKNN